MHGSHFNNNTTDYTISYCGQLIVLTPLSLKAEVWLGEYFINTDIKKCGPGVVIENKALPRLVREIDNAGLFVSKGKSHHEPILSQQEVDGLRELFLGDN